MNSTKQLSRDIWDAKEVGSIIAIQLDHPEHVKELALRMSQMQQLALGTPEAKILSDIYKKADAMSEERKEHIMLSVQPLNDRNRNIHLNLVLHRLNQINMIEYNTSRLTVKLTPLGAETGSILASRRVQAELRK